MMIKSFNEFINESVRDLMKPKSEEEIIFKLKSLTQKQKNNKLIETSNDGLLNIVKYLVENGADVNAFDNLIFTPLMYASYRGHLDIVKYLVENGADVNAVDYSNQTILMRACSPGHLDIVKYLIEKGADINVKDKKGRSALDKALENKHYNIVKYFKNLGVNESVRDLMKPKTEEEIKKVFKKLSKKEKNNKLSDALREGNLDMIRFLVEEGADIQLVEDFPMGARYHFGILKELDELIKKYKKS